MGNRSLLFAAGLAIALPAAALTEPAGLAPALRASAAEAPAFMLNGNGVYIYQCQISASVPAVYQWAFVVPDATLFEGSRSVARFATAGLIESTSDRSSISGVVRSSQAAGVNNLPWVLMAARPLSEAGMFAGITSIQRVNTSGGAAPTTGCGAGNLGAETRVAFQADYYFYRARGAS